MGSCVDCKHFRKVKLLSALLGREAAMNYKEVTEALKKISDDEIQQKSAEDSQKAALMTSNILQWPLRPVVHSFCGQHEHEGKYEIAELKNAGETCDQFDEGTPQRRACADCVHALEPKGYKKDALMQQEYQSMISSSTAAGGSTKNAESLLDSYRASVGPRMALELQQAYSSREGRMFEEPKYLKRCGKYSTEEEYVVCAVYNQYDNCRGWEPRRTVNASERGRSAETANYPGEKVASGPTTQDPATVPPIDPEAKQMNNQSGDVLVSGPPTLTEDLAMQFRMFVEWVLEADLSEEQEAELRTLLIQQWSRNDTQLMAFVNASNATLQQLKDADQETRIAWRQQNQPIFMAFMTLALPRLLDILGERAQSAWSKGRNESPLAAGNNPGPTSETTTGNLARGTANRSVQGMLNEMLEEQRKEVEKLRATDPELALQRELHNEQTRSTLLHQIWQTQHETNMKIAGNLKT